MAIYLVDYENVYIEGLDGLEFLRESDEVVIFYTQNRCGLTFELHRRLISSQARVSLMEVTALSTRKNTVKNALDLQLSMYIGYLLGRCSQQSIYIISKDTDFDLNVAFFQQYLQTEGKTLEIYSTLKNAVNGEEKSEIPSSEEENSAKSEGLQTIPGEKGDIAVVVFPKALQEHVQEILGIDDASFINRICAFLMASEDLVTLNNLLTQYYHDGQQVKKIYHKLKPAFGALRNVAVGALRNAVISS